MRLLAKIAAGVVSLALFAAAMWLHDAKPRLEDRQLNPIASHGRVGTVVTNHDFSVRVDKVQVANSISKPQLFGRPDIMPSLGVFVIVNVSVKSNQKPFLPGHVRLSTRGGRSYQVSGRPDLPDSNDEFQPMLWGHASYIFEIPKDRLAGAQLVVGVPDATLMDQLSARAEIDLGIDRAKAERLLAHPSSYELKTT